MAKKKVVVVKKTRISKLAVMAAELAEIKVAVNNYFASVRYQQPEDFKFDLAAKTTDGKDAAFNVPSLLASVLTAQGLGKEARLIAAPDPKGGMLQIRFYTPVARPTALQFSF
jgi:hypothetical protein